MDKKKSLKNWKSKNRAFNRNAKIDRREYELKNMSPARREMIKKNLDCEKTDLQNVRDKIFPSHMQKENKEIQKELNVAKNIIRLTESDLHRIVKESVKRILNEVGNTKDGRDKINTAMQNVHKKELRKAIDGEETKRTNQLFRVNNYMKNGPHGKEWNDEHGDWFKTKESQPQFKD